MIKRKLPIVRQRQKIAAKEHSAKKLKREKGYNSLNSPGMPAEVGFKEKKIAAKEHRDRKEITHKFSVSFNLAALLFDELWQSRVSGP